jgi:hypothetical protein
MIWKWFQSPLLLMLVILFQHIIITATTINSNSSTSELLTDSFNSLDQAMDQQIMN